MVQHYDPAQIPAVYNIDDIPEYNTRPGVTSRTFRGVDSMVGLATLGPEMEPKPHSHPWEQVVFIHDGSTKFHVGDEVVELSTGDIMVIPPGVEHCAAPHTDEPCTNVDIWPLREDYLHRTEYQTEFLRE